MRLGLRAAFAVREPVPISCYDMPSRRAACYDMYIGGGRSGQPRARRADDGRRRALHVLKFMLCFPVTAVEPAGHSDLIDRSYPINQTRVTRDRSPAPTRILYSLIYLWQPLLCCLLTPPAHLHLRAHRHRNVGEGPCALLLLGVLRSPAGRLHTFRRAP